MRKASRLCSAALCASLLVQLAGCGTLLYPERRGQIEGRIDPAVAVLNAVGLLIYVIPGLIAFGIDFATGAIYLPDGKYSLAPEKLRETLDETGQPDPLRLKALIETETGRSLPLDDPRLIRHTGDAEHLALLSLRPAG